MDQILLAAQSQDPNERNNAEGWLRGQLQEYPSFLSALSYELADDGKLANIRMYAGLIMKDVLDERWLALDIAVKSKIKACLLQTLTSPVPDACSTSSELIVKVAGIEVRHKQWPELIDSLISIIQDLPAHSPACVKQAYLETLGNMCKELSPDVVEQDKVDSILFVVAQQMNANDADYDVKLAATLALHNALGIARAIFSDDDTRNEFMRIVYCVATQAQEVKIKQAAFECLVSIPSKYYGMLSPYLPDIANTTFEAVTKDEELVALQALEFWTSICRPTVDGVKSDGQCFEFIKQNLHGFVHMLFETLLKQKEDQEKSTWKLATAGGNCLGMFAQIVGDDIVPIVRELIEQNIQSPEWKRREGATYALGCILQGPSVSVLAPIFRSALCCMVFGVKVDSNSHVRSTSAWAIGRIFENFCGSTIDITPSKCRQILTVLLKAMTDSPNVAEKACSAVHFLVRSYEEGGSSSPVTSSIFKKIVEPGSQETTSTVLKKIVDALDAVTNREDASESRLRTAAYETLNEVVRCSPNETIPVVYGLRNTIFEKLKQSVSATNVSSDVREKHIELLCRCLEVIIRKPKSSDPHMNIDMQYADQMMSLFPYVFSCSSATVHEAAMLAIGSLAYAMGTEFIKYMEQQQPPLREWLQIGLQNFKVYQVCAATVHVVRDICMALKEKILPYCDEIMRLLRVGLESKELDNSVKPSIFSCFGDIAIAIGGENFDKYLADAVCRLQVAAEWISSSAVDDEMVEYIKLLRIGILEGYSGIFQGFKNSAKLQQLLIPYATHILQFLDSIYAGKDMDDELMKKANVALGGLVLTLGSHEGPQLLLKNLLSKCLSSI